MEDYEWMREFSTCCQPTKSLGRVGKDVVWASDAHAVVLHDRACGLPPLGLEVLESYLAKAPAWIGHTDPWHLLRHAFLYRFGKGCDACCECGYCQDCNRLLRIGGYGFSARLISEALGKLSEYESGGLAGLGIVNIPSGASLVLWTLRWSYMLASNRRDDGEPYIGCTLEALLNFES